MPIPALTDRDRFQVAAFHAFFKAARIGGKDIDTAFVDAIINSSDEETAKVLAKDPNAIQRWLEFEVPITNETQTERTYDEDY